MKAITHQHKCKKISGTGPQYMVVKSVNGDRGWEVWIPDFLHDEDTSVKSFVWNITYCPFCGVELSETAKGVKEVNP